MGRRRRTHPPLRRSYGRTSHPRPTNTPPLPTPIEHSFGKGSPFIVHVLTACTPRSLASSSKSWKQGRVHDNGRSPRTTSVVLMYPPDQGATENNWSGMSPSRVAFFSGRLRKLTVFLRGWLYLDIIRRRERVDIAIVQ